MSKNLSLAIIICILITTIKMHSLPPQVNVEYTVDPPKLCELCKMLAPPTISLVKANQISLMNKTLIDACMKYLQFDLTMCMQGLDTYFLPAFNIIASTSLTGDDLCNIMLKCTFDEPTALNWNIDDIMNIYSKAKPPVQPIQISPLKPQKRILHLADIHIDPDYVPGSIVNCKNLQCCRNNSELIPGETPILAGFWGGSTNCDIPIWTVERLFDQIAKTEQFDFIYWTGDIGPHNIWNQSNNQQLDTIKTITYLFKKYFPCKTVYSALGNHEAYPSNMFPREDNNITNLSWLYNAVSYYWRVNRLPRSTIQNVTYGGFYTVRLNKYARVISLNMNFCFIHNFWLYNNSKDPFHQLEWLIQVLQYSEDNNEKVHIIGHISPGDECLPSFSKAYYKIVARYENTITGQFFGHSHKDYVQIFYDLDLYNSTNKTVLRPLNVAYVAPSVTTYGVKNSAYRIYTVDGYYHKTTFRVVDFETRVMDIEKANANNETIWQMEYRATKAYNMKNLLPDQWEYLYNQMISSYNCSLADKYINFFFKSSDQFDTCDTQCRINIICKMRQARSDAQLTCNSFGSQDF